MADKTIESSAVRELLESSEGKFISVFFHKQNGDERWMTGRLGVAKGVQGNGEMPAHLLTIWDTNVEQHRRIIPENMEIIKMNGNVYTVVNG